VWRSRSSLIKHLTGGRGGLVASKMLDIAARAAQWA
jgi:hypothetical protein